MREVLHNFKDWYSLPSIHGAIDCTHVDIKKPPHFSEDYYYYKIVGYSIVAQVVIDCKKQFTSFFIGLRRFVNDTRISHHSALQNHIGRRELMYVEAGTQVGYPPYLLTDKDYPCLNQMVTAFKDDTSEIHIVGEEFDNKCHQKGRSVIENAFCLMKENKSKMLDKTNLHIIIVPNIFNCCCILHNLTIKKDRENIKELMHRLHRNTEDEMCRRNGLDWWLTAQRRNVHNIT